MVAGKQEAMQFVLWLYSLATAGKGVTREIRKKSAQALAVWMMLTSHAVTPAPALGNNETMRYLKTGSQSLTLRTTTFLLHFFQDPLHVPTLPK